MGNLILNKCSLFIDFQFQKNQSFILHFIHKILWNEQREMGLRRVSTITVIPFISIKDVKTTAPKNFYLKAKINTS